MLKMVTNEVPVGLEAYYEPTENNSFKLKVEGAVPVSEFEAIKQKNKEFRDNNVTLLKEKEKFESFAKVIGGDMTPEKLNEKIDAMAMSKVGTLTENMKSSYETKLKEMNTNLDKANSRLSKLVLDNEVTKVATEHGVLSSALEDVMLRAKTAFDVVDGEVKFKEGKLDAEGKPYSIQSWIQEQRTKASHLFAPSQGTGSKRPSVAGNRTSAAEVQGVDRIAAAFAQRNKSSSKVMN